MSELNAPIGKNGKPMIAVVGNIKESIPNPRVEYANITLGPIGVIKWVEDELEEDWVEREKAGKENPSRDKLLGEINAVQELVEEAAGEQRSIILENLGA